MQNIFKKTITKNQIEKIFLKIIYAENLFLLAKLY